MFKKKAHFFGKSLGSDLLLDLYPADTAYSLRKLSSTYTGSAIRVRRSSDNAEQDIGFNGVGLDTVSLLSFVGGGDGFVSVWYDQSGNNLNATAIQQPLIVTAGVLNLDNSTPYMQMTGNETDGLKLPVQNGFNSANASFFSIYNGDTLGGNGMILATKPSGLYLGALELSSSSSAVDNQSGLQNYYYNGNLISSPTRGLLFSNYITNQDVLVSILDVNFIDIRWNNDNIIIHHYTSNSFTNKNKLKETIIYNSDQSANREAIETNINNYYSIY